MANRSGYQKRSRSGTDRGVLAVHHADVGEREPSEPCPPPERDMPAFEALYTQGRLPIAWLKSGLIRLDETKDGFDRLADATEVRHILVFD